MQQADLDRAVARVTGETVSTIKQRGFLLADANSDFDPDPPEYEPNIVDWDELESQRRTGINGRGQCEPAIA